MFLHVKLMLHTIKELTTSLLDGDVWTVA